MSNKPELRTKILQIRNNLKPEEIEAKSAIIQSQVLALACYDRARSVMLYLNTKNEVVTTDLARKTLSLGKKLVVPLCQRGDIIPCQILNMEKDLRSGMLGIREPHPERCVVVAPEEIDLVLVPGVAFDKLGNRIGLGKGYYDRFLPQIREDVCAIGLAYACQVVDQIEAQEHDYKMSLLITENSVIYPA